MEELGLDGLFWPASNQDDKVAGHLTFSPTDGAHLDLIGSFHGLEEFLDRTNHSLLIHGVAGGKLLTLIDCLRTQQSMQIPGIAREKYRPFVVLSGCQLNQDQLLDFTGVHVKLRHLDSWIWKTGTTIKFTPDKQSNGIERIHITHNPLEKQVAQMDTGVLELVFTYRFQPDPFRTTALTQSAMLGMRFSEPQSLQHIFEICSRLRDLVTIGVNTPASITEVSLTHSDIVYESSGGSLKALPIELYGNWLGDHRQSDSTDLNPRQMLFTFDDIGGLTGIAQWLEASAKFRLVIGSLLSHWYLPTIYTDNRFLNIIIAAEALERIRLNRQSFNFDDGLKRLVNYAGQPFQALVQDAEPWINEIVRARNNNLVHRGLHEDLEGPRMFWLSESVYFLVVLCLLRECGIAESTLSNLRDHQQFRLIAGRLQDTV